MARKKMTAAEKKAFAEKMKKARAAAARKRKAPVKKKAPAKRKTNPAKRDDSYIVEVRNLRNELGYLSGWDANGPIFYTEKSKALKLPKAGADTLMRAVHANSPRGLLSVESKKLNATDYKTNPVPPSSVAKMKNAVELYEEFSGNPAEYYDTVDVEWPDVGLKVGKVDGIMYTTNRDGKTEHYIHKFKNRSRPTFVASHNGKHLALIGGKFTFTERGIVDN